MSTTNPPSHVNCSAKCGGRSGGAFTLVEVLVAVAVIGLLVAILVPSLSRARLQSKVAKVRAELYQVGLGLEAYHDTYRDYPWATAVCFGGGSVDAAYNQLPMELRGGKAIGSTGRPGRGWIPDGLEDPFNAGQQYKYLRHVGWNNGIPDSSIPIWVPGRFPYDRADSRPVDDKLQSKFRRGPVEFAVWSVGPGGDPWTTSIEACEIYRVPIPKRTWYSYQNGADGPGVIPLIRSGKHGFVQWSDPGRRTSYLRAY